MKIVQVEDFFHPLAGYQVNILSKYFVKKGHEVIIICAEMSKLPDKLTSFFGKENIDTLDKEYEIRHNVKILRIPVKGYYSGRVWYSKKIFRIVKDINPDILYVHGNDTLIGMQYILKSHKLPFPIITDSHMLEMASRNRFKNVFRKFYRVFVTPRIIKNGIQVIRTQDNDFIQRYLGIPLDLSPWISIGSDTMLFHPDAKMKEIFRKNNNISINDFVVLYAGKLDEAKGGMFLANTLKNRFNAKRRIVVIVVGTSAGEYGNQVNQLLDSSENIILRFPTQKYEDLATFYQAADIAVFPKQCSLSFYDVQASGLPVVFENNIINIDRAKHSNALTFESDNVIDFRSKIEFLADLSEDEFNKMRNNAIEYILQNYNYDKIADEYLRVLDIVFRNRNEKI